MESSIKITYESLFELLRNEKNREELQQLDKSFFKNIIEYLNEKRAILDKSEDNIFVKSEKEKTVQQLANIKRIIRDLYQRREKKIISMALIKSRVDAKVDISNLLEEEKLIFDRLVKVFDNFRDGILGNILEGKEVDIKKEGDDAVKKESSTKCDNQKPDDQTNDEKGECENSMVRFIQYVPTFIGIDLNNYGPFEPEDMACLPNKMVKVLIEKKAAEKISIK